MLRRYGSDDPEIFNAASTRPEEFGIDVLVLSWMGPGGTDINLKRVLAANKTRKVR